MAGSPDRDEQVRDAIYRARLLVNRAPHLSPSSRREANRGLDILENQLGLNQVHAGETARAFELVNRAHASIAFGLLRDRAVAERFGPGLRHLGLRGLGDRLDEVTHPPMATPIPGPIAREHRDDLPAEERFDAEGRPLPPPPGYY